MPAPQPTLSQLLREGNRFTDRDFMKLLSMGHPKLKACEANPLLFTLKDLLLLAELIGRPVREVLRVVLAEVEPQVAELRNLVASQAAGRKNFPRTPPVGEGRS